MISIIATLTEMESSILCQEMLQALMWLGCALIGWGVSSSLLTLLGKKRGLTNCKATAGSAAFKQEVAQYVTKTCLGVAAQHFGLTETQVQQYCADLKGQCMPANTTSATETSSAVEAPCLTAPSSHVGHVLLEHYDVFHTREGAWSGPLEDSNEVEEQVDVLNDTSPRTPLPRSPSVEIPLSAFEEIKAEEFFEGSESISLWLVPDGVVYDHAAHGWAFDAATI